MQRPQKTHCRSLLEKIKILRFFIKCLRCLRNILQTGKETGYEVEAGTKAI